jgi:hypothetical protein
MRGVAALWICAWPLALRAAEPPPQAALERARNELKNLGYSEARPLLDAALNEGGHSREELAEIYALRGEVEAVLEGADASEREFRKLMVLDPHHAPPKRETPTFMLPFESARKWAQRAGALTIEHVPPATAPAAARFDVTVRIVSDPLAMVAGAKVLYRDKDAAPFTRTPTVGLRQTLEAGPKQTSYYIEVVDRWGNKLMAFGNETAPLRPTLKEAELSLSGAPASPPVRWYRSPVGWSLCGVGLLGLGAGAVLLAEASLAVSAARTAADRDTYLAARGRAIDFDGAGGALVGVGGALFIGGLAILISRAQRPKVRTTGWHGFRMAPLVQGGL